MALSLNLQKSSNALRLSLEKRGIVRMPALEMACALDVSGSFEDEHADGITNELLARLAPWGLTFDPDRKIDVLTFSDGAESAHRVGSLDESNYADFVQRRIIDNVPGWGGGTDYSYVLERALQEFGWLAEPGWKTGFIGRLLGRAEPAQRPPRRSLLVFVTDGDNQDDARTRQVLRDSQSRRDGVYFLFLGIANGGSPFRFLRSIGDEFENTGFREIENIREFVRRSDDEINDMLIDDELLGWLKG